MGIYTWAKVQALFLQTNQAAPKKPPELPVSSHASPLQPPHLLSHRALGKQAWPNPRAAWAPERLQGDRENGKIPSPVLAKPRFSPPAGPVLNWVREKQKEKGARGKRQSQPGETQQKFLELLFPLESPVPTLRAPRASATCTAVCGLGMGSKLCR